MQSKTMTVPSFFFLNLFIFNWRIIALQCCWFLPYSNINQPQVYIFPSLMNFLPTPVFFFLKHYLLLHGLGESQFPPPGIKPRPWQQKPRILATKPPGNSMFLVFEQRGSLIGLEGQGKLKTKMRQKRSRSRQRERLLFPARSVPLFRSLSHKGWCIILILGGTAQTLLLRTKIIDSFWHGVGKMGIKCLFF